MLRSSCTSGCLPQHWTVHLREDSTTCSWRGLGKGLYHSRGISPLRRLPAQENCPLFCRRTAALIMKPKMILTSSVYQSLEWPSARQFSQWLKFISTIPLHQIVIWPSAKQISHWLKQLPIYIMFP